MKRLAWSIVTSLATLTVVFLLWEFRGAIVLFLLSLVVAAAVRPLADRLGRVGLSPGWAFILLYAAGLGLLVILGYLFGPSLLNELRQFLDSLSLAYERIRVEWPAGNSLQQMVAERLPPSADLFDALGGEQGIYLAQAIFGATASVFSVIGQALIVLVLSVYWGISRTRFERLWLSLLPAKQRARARDVWQEIEIEIGAYVRSEIVQGLLAALLLGAGYWWLGLRYPILLALVGAVAWLVPLVGGFLAVVPAALIGWQGGPTLAVMSAIYTLAVFFVLEVAIESHFFNRRRYSSLLLVLMMILLSNDMGLLGLILAPPLAVAIQIIFASFVRQAVPVKVEAVPLLIDLQERLAEVELLAAEMEDETPTGINSMIERLRRLIKQASQLLGPEQALPTRYSVSGFTPATNPASPSEKRSEAMPEVKHS